MTKLAAIVGAVITVSSAAAADDAPSSLRMRDPAPAAAPAAATQAAVAAEDDGHTEVISVTGPTVEHDLFTGRAPVAVVTRADLDAAGRTTLGDILQALPAQSNAGNAQVNAGGDGTTRINLRGLGAARTLVLLNGRRMVNAGAGADASVDLNSIPLAMVERVEIWKDGASAIYGADAVGGVVNVITHPQFDGVDVSLLASTSQRGDGTEYDASFVTGFTTKNKHTYLVVSASYQGHDPVFAADRGFSTFQKMYDFPTGTERRSASLATPYGRLDTSSIGAGGIHPPGCASNVCRPDPAGGFTDFVAPGDLYNDATGNYLYTPSSRYSGIATAGNRINDYAGIVIEAMYLHRNSDRQLSPVAFEADTPISKDSVYNPLGGDILDYRRRITELGPRQFIDQANMLRFVAGVTGSVPPSFGPLEGWKYEVSFNHGDAKTAIETTGQLSRPRLADALGPSMRDADGHLICVRTPGDPRTQIIYTIPIEKPHGVLNVPCVPFNVLAPAGAIPHDVLPFHPENPYLSTDQLNPLTYTDQGVGTDSQRTLLATAHGEVARLPHGGEITLSLGGDYRAETGEQQPPAVASTGQSTDNLAQPTEGDLHLYEGYGELAIVPVLAHPIAQHIEVDLGARALRHSQYGSSFTYKAGGLFRTLGGIAARATYATAFRAPSLPDTFGGLVERPTAAEDPCDTAPPSLGDARKTLDPKVAAQCAAQGVPEGSRFNTNQQRSATGGNPDLKPETAATTSIGVVIEPPRVPGLVATADYWHIAIDHAIETLGVHTILASCYDRGDQAFCDQIHRDPITHRILRVDQILQNVRRTTTSGIDLALWYDTKIARVGRFHTGLEGQYLLRYDLRTATQVLHGVGFYDLGVYPRYKANLSTRWAHPSGASGGAVLRFVGAYQECADNNCNDRDNLATASREVARYLKLDLFGGYDFGSRLGKTTLQVGCNNVFDATPPVVYNAAAANSDAATYDFIGRMVYLRLSQRF